MKRVVKTNSRLIKMFVVIEIIALLACGCNHRNSDYVIPEVLAREQGETIMQAIISKKTEPIEELLCSYVVENHPDLESEIIGMFDFIDGDIISYDEPLGEVTAGKTDAKVGIIEESICCGFEKVKTSTGKTYRIGHGGYSVYKKHPEYEGVTNITVFDEDLCDSETGYPDEAIYTVYLPEMWED